MKAYDTHVPVLAARRTAAGGLETPKPIVYGTAFTVAPGIFLTAGHVLKDALNDGVPGLSIVRPGEELMAHAVVDYELVEAVDLALLRCPSLQSVPSTPIEFDRRLDFLAPVSAMGFPMAMDAEFVRLVPRAFGGHVITSRELYHLPGQPPGYELSFFAPQGLSGAPLISTAYGPPRCYGYVIQQSTIGIGGHPTPVGIAVTIQVLLNVKTSAFVDNQPLARLFGREFRPPPPQSIKHLPGGMRPPATLDEGWPDDDLQSPELDGEGK